jgi:hypothetical protein
MNRIDWAGTQSNEAQATGLLFDWAPTFIDGIILIDAALASDEAPFAIAIPPAVTDAALGSDSTDVNGVGVVLAEDAALASDEPDRVGIGAVETADGVVVSDDLDRASESKPEEARFKARRWTYSRDDV